MRYVFLVLTLVMVGMPVMAKAQDYEQYGCVVYTASAYKFSNEKTELFEMDISNKEKYKAIIIIDKKKNVGIFIPEDILNKIDIKNSLKKDSGKIMHHYDKKTFFLKNSRILVTMWEKIDQYIKIFVNVHISSNDGALQNIFEYGYCTKLN